MNVGLSSNQNLNHWNTNQIHSENNWNTKEVFGLPIIPKITNLEHLVFQLKFISLFIVLKTNTIRRNIELG